MRGPPGLNDVEVEDVAVAGNFVWKSEVARILEGRVIVTISVHDDPPCHRSLRDNGLQSFGSYIVSFGHGGMVRRPC